MLASHDASPFLNESCTVARFLLMPNLSHGCEPFGATSISRSSDLGSATVVRTFVYSSNMSFLSFHVHSECGTSIENESAPPTRNSTTIALYGLPVAVCFIGVGSSPCRMPHKNERRCR